MSKALAVSVRACLLLLIALLIVTVPTLALDEQEEEVTMEEAFTGGAAHTQRFSTTCLLPQSPVALNIAAGETVDLLLGVMNKEAVESEYVYRAEYAVAYLLNADPAFAIQNFTGVAYSRTVHPNEAATLKYRIRPDHRLEPKDYQLLVQLFYMNERNETFLATPFNGTVTITDALGNKWDLTSLMHYTGIVILLGLMTLLPLYRVWLCARRNGYLGSSRSKGGSSSGAKGGRGTGSRLAVDPKAELDWSYVSAEHRTFAQQSAAAQRGGSSKGAKKH